jgi:hypothetical protein
MEVGGMKWIAGWIIVFVVSWTLGLIISIIAVKGKENKVLGFFGLALFVLPVIFLATDLIRQSMVESNFKAAAEEVKVLCDKDGGDKIYKTVDNVQGILQMRARKPKSYRRADGSFYNAMADQYGMEDPFAEAQFDHDDMASAVGSAVGINAPPRGKQGYWFIEQQPKYGSPKGSEYRRNYLTILENPEAWQIRASNGNPLYKVKQFKVSNLKSRYGYLTEDLTTKEMRDHWIGAGRIKIIDLQTNEVLAERKGYFRASGDLLPDYADRWSGFSRGMCSTNGNLLNFLQSVLKPPQDFPTNEQLESIAKD